MKEHPPKHSSTHPQKSTKLKVEKEALFNPETSFFSQNNSTQSDRPFFTNIPANPFFKAASPPIQMKGAKINNDPTLEKDADKMGDKASQMVGKKNPKLQNVSTYTNNEVIQAKFFNLQQPMTAWDQMLSPGIEGNEKTSQETVLKLLKITQLIDQFQSASSALIAKNKLKALQEFLDSWYHKSLI